MGIKIKNAPLHIYLNIGFNIEDEEIDFGDLSQVTWSEAEIDTYDIQYIQMVEYKKLQKENEELKKSNKNLENNYLSAVQGRNDFRQSFKNKREEANLLQKQIEELKVSLDLVMKNSEIVAEKWYNIKKENKKLKANKKKDCLDFFYWWYNQPGNNTEQGYNEWEKLKERSKEK